MAKGTIRTLLAGAVVGGSVVSLAWWVSGQPSIPKHPEVIAAYNQGRADALKLNPVSWELEETCANLWLKSLPLDSRK